MNEVDGWLRKGLGRAATFLKTHDSRPWREQLLYARTHDLAYDSRCEPTRAPYLWDLIELSGEPDFYREQIIEFLGKDDEELYLEQIFAIAANFAANGSHIAKEAMYGAFQRRGFAAAGIGCAEQLVILDGLNGLLFVARTFGELEVDERPWKFGVLIEELEKHHGKQVLPSELDRFVQEWQEDEKSRASEQVKVPKPRLNYDEINRRIVEKGRRSGMVYWGKSATDEELAKLAHDVLSETDSGRLYGFLRMFQIPCVSRAVGQIDGACSRSRRRYCIGRDDSPFKYN